MPVFDFSAAPEDSKQPECTYTTFQSNEETATPEKPIMILDNTKDVRFTGFVNIPHEWCCHHTFVLSRS